MSRHGQACGRAVRGGSPAVRGWRVCRVHGAGGGHPAGRGHPRWKHGMRSREWVEMRRSVNKLVREVREIEQMVQR
jgi:hypothetical protein